MASFNNDVIDRLIKHADIVKVISSYLSVNKKGKDYKAICPFHDDTDPSLSISPEKRVFKCFACGTSGNAITFVQKYKHISFREAMLEVAEMTGFQDPELQKTTYVKPVDEKKEALLKCTHDLTLYYEYALNSQEGKEGLSYFEGRHLDKDLRAKYHLGYAFKDGKANCKFLLDKGHSLKTIEDIGIAMVNGGTPIDRNQGRVIFPICDYDGNVIGYSARRLKDSDEAKYVNSPETVLFHKSSVLYNYHIAKEKAKIADCIYVLEGFMDVYALAKIGMDNAIALMGTAMTEEHVKALRYLNVEVRMCLDGDLPGQKATLKISKMLAKEGVRFRIVDNQGSSKDPDEILNQDGPDALKYYLNNLISRVDFALNYYLRTNPLKTLNEKKLLIQEFIPILINVDSQLELDSYLRKLASITGFEMESIRTLVNKARRNKDNEEQTKRIIEDFHPERKLLARLCLAEKEVLYQMLNSTMAIKYYEDNLGSFYDDMYRTIALYILDYYQEFGSIDTPSLISFIENSDLENKDAIINEIINVYQEKNHPSECTMELLESLSSSINEEKGKIYEKDTLQESLIGKDPLEQARIINEYNKRKVKREQDKEAKK